MMLKRNEPDLVYSTVCHSLQDAKRSLLQLGTNDGGRPCRVKLSLNGSSRRLFGPWLDDADWPNLLIILSYDDGVTDPFHT